MKRFLLTSCATALVLSVAGGNSAIAQTNGSYTVPSGTTVVQAPSQPITDQGGTATTVTATGGGVLELDGLNSYTGGTSISGNTTLRVGQDANLGAATGSLTMGDATTSGILQIGGGTTNASSSFTSNRGIMINSGGAQINNFNGGNATFNGQISGNGGLTVNQGIVALTNNANSYQGETTIANGAQLIVSTDAQLGAPQVTSSGVTLINTVNLGDANKGGSLTIAPGVTGFTSGRTININGTGGTINGSVGGGVATFTGLVEGGGALIINNGIVALTNTANTYSGGTIIQNGATLQISTDSQLGSSYNQAAYNNSQAAYGYGQVSTTPITYSQISLGNGVSGGTLQFTNSQAVSDSFSFALNSGGVNSILTNSAAPVTLNGQILGAGGLTVGGTGTLILSSANNFTGDLRVSNGATLQISNDNQLGGYTSSTNYVTGQVNSTPNLAANGALALNTVHLDGGTLQVSTGTTLLHNLTTSSQNSTIDTGTNNVLITGNIGDDGATSGGIVKIGAGTLTLDGTSSYTGGTMIQNGALVVGDANYPKASLTGDVTINTGAILGGSGTITGTVINNGGAVAPANVLTVDGYIQGSGSVLAPELSPGTTVGTTSSELKVTGTAAIGGGTLSVGYAPGFLKAGQYEIFTAGAIAGSGFSTVNAGIIPSAGLTAQIMQQGDSYYVVLTQKADVPDHPTVLPSLTSAAIDQAQQTTGALLDRLATARTNALADELAVAMTDTHRVRGTTPFGLWVQPVGEMGSQNGAGALPGYTTQGEGFLMGADTEWFPGVSIGVALGYTHNSLSEGSGGASGTNSTPLLAFYGGWWKGPFAIDAVAGIGMGLIDGARPVDLPLAGTTANVMQIANSSHTANQKFAALQASGAWALDGWVIGPQLGAKFVNLRETSYTETGTDIYNYTVASNSINSLRPFVSVDLSKRIFIGDHWALVPDVKAGYEREVNNSARQISAQTEGDAQLWVFNGLLPGANILHFVGGMKLELDRSEAFYVSYDHQQSNTGQTEYITGGFRYRL